MRRYDQSVLSAAWKSLDPLTRGVLQLMRGLSSAKNSPEILPPDFYFDVSASKRESQPVRDS